MDSVFTIVKYGQTGIQVNGLEKDSGEYLSDTAPILPSRRQYSYSESVTLNVLFSSDSAGNKTLVTYDFVDHTVSTVDTDSFNISADGLYTISHIILPTKAWFTDVNSQDANYISTNYGSAGYYYDSGNIYYIDYSNSSTVTSISITNLLLINATAPATTTEKTNTIIRTDKDTFIMYFIKNDYGRVNETLFNDSLYVTKDDIIMQQKYYREIIRLYIDAMRYQVDLGNLYRAQYYIERYMPSRNQLITPIINGSNY